MLRVRRRIYAERVDTLMLEVYTTRPYLVFRDLITGRFTKAPDVIIMTVVMSAKTGGGKEPLEAEVIVSEEIDVKELRKLQPEEIIEFLNKLESELVNEAFNVARENFGTAISAMLEEGRRELTLEKRPHIIKKWRHYRRYTDWRVEVHD